MKNLRINIDKKDILNIYLHEELVKVEDVDYEKGSDSYSFWLNGNEHKTLISEILNCKGSDIYKQINKSINCYISEPSFLLSLPNSCRHYITDEIYKEGTVSILIRENNSSLEISNYYPEEIIEKWNLKWSIIRCLNLLENCLIESSFDFKTDNRFGKKEQSISIKTNLNNESFINESIKAFYKNISVLGNEVELKLNEDIWLKKYETDEDYFCTNFLSPLLISMKFKEVNYCHGTREYGKDFTFSAYSKFNTIVNYGLQAKAGNISGKVNSDIDELIGQIEDAFCMPYYSLGSKNENYISVFIIAISGKFTNNAKEKIMHKVNNRFGKLMGAIEFLDKEKLIEIHSKYR